MMTDARYRVVKRRWGWQCQRKAPGQWFWRNIAPFIGYGRGGWKTEESARWFNNIWRRSDQR